MHIIQLTKQGLEELQKEYDDLQEKRKEAVTELATARSMGDLSENAAYKVARQKLSRIDSRGRYLENIMKKVHVIELKKDGYIDIGSKVTIDDGVQKRTLQLVDGYESDFNRGKISVYSPIGKELRGKIKGDKIKVRLPNGMQEYTITAT